MPTLKDLATNNGVVVSQEALQRTLSELKTYINTQAAVPAQQVQEQLNALIGAQGGDADKLLNTFNDIKAFLADYDEDDTLKSLLDAVDTAIGNERTRAEGVESGLNTRLTALEGVEYMTSAQAKTLFDTVFTSAASSSSSSSSSSDSSEG